MATQIIGLSGRKRSGKDTLAAHFVEKHGFTRFAFADPLREAVLALDPLVSVQQDEQYLINWYKPAWDVSYLRLSNIVRELGWEKAKGIREVRRLLQAFGSESIRTLDDTFWVRITMEKVDALPGPVVITDMRFPNEYDAVKDRQGTLVRVTRGSFEIRKEELHVSETALDHHDFDWVAHNGGTIEDLYHHIDRWWNSRQVAVKVNDVTWSAFGQVFDEGAIARARFRDLLDDWHNRPGTRVPERVLDQGNFGE